MSFNCSLGGGPQISLPKESDFPVVHGLIFSHNHPSVIIYISGNEIQEAASAKGAELKTRITEKFHVQDGRGVDQA